MPRVTGRLTDFGLDSLNPYAAVITFTPSSPASTPAGHLLATRPISVSPDVLGDFSVELVSGDGTMPAIWYFVTVEWLDAPLGFTGKDFPTWRLHVPAEGGSIGDIGWAPSSPALAYFGTEPPSGDTFAPGTWWLDADLTDPADPDASGILYEWSN